MPTPSAATPRSALEKPSCDYLKPAPGSIELSSPAAPASSLFTTATSEITGFGANAKSAYDSESMSFDSLIGSDSDSSSLSAMGRMASAMPVTAPNTPLNSVGTTIFVARPSAI